MRGWNGAESGPARKRPRGGQTFAQSALPARLNVCMLCRRTRATHSLHEERDPLIRATAGEDRFSRDVDGMTRSVENGSKEE